MSACSAQPFLFHHLWQPSIVVTAPGQGGRAGAIAPRRRPAPPSGRPWPAAVTWAA